MGLDNPLHIAVLVVLVLLVFGAKRLPEIGRSLGSGMREFKESVTGESKPALGTGEQQPAQQPAAMPTSQPQQQPPQQPATAPAAQPQQQPPEPVAAQPGTPSEQQSNPFGG